MKTGLNKLKETNKMEIQLTRTELILIIGFLLSLIGGSIVNGGYGVLAVLITWIGGIVYVAMVVAFCSVISYGVGYGYAKGRQRAERDK